MQLLEKEKDFDEAYFMHQVLFWKQHTWLDSTWSHLSQISWSGAQY